MLIIVVPAAEAALVGLVYAAQAVFTVPMKAVKLVTDSQQEPPSRAAPVETDSLALPGTLVMRKSLVRFWP